MALNEYVRKRSFESTPEPKPVSRDKSTSGNSFCVQRHDASRLHYDFRLEMDGALKSWAVPKGPTLDPTQKHLAAHVEDHPIEYGGFEGNIPKGQYGGGSVMLWEVPEAGHTAAFSRWPHDFEQRVCAWFRSADRR